MLQTKLQTSITGITLVGMLGTAAIAQDSPAPPRDRPLRVMVVTGGHGFEREPFFEIFNDHPDITWFEVKQPEALTFFAPDKADRYDVMVWYDMFQDITDQAKGDLVKLLERGKPLVALHHCLADYQAWPEAVKIMGGRFHLQKTPAHRQSTYKHDVDIPVKIADANHPVTRFMKDFVIHDEVYNHTELLPGVKPLLTTNHPESTKVIGWTHTYGKSPVAYIMLGHDAKAYTNPNFRRLVTQAIRWTAGRLPDPSEEGYVKLLNGKNLDGWTVMGDPVGFKMIDGGVLRSDLPHKGQWLRSNRQYGDFILRAEWRVSNNGNSGVFVRSKIEGDPWTTGSEIQISHEPRDNAHCTGSLYGSVAVNPRPDESPDTWHAFEVHCIGPRYRVFSDNVPIIDVDARKVPALWGRPLLGYVGVQDCHSSDGYIEYRNIRIKELKMSDGDATAWRLGTQTYTFNRFTLFEAIDKAKSIGLKYIEAYPGQRLSPDAPDVKFSHDAPVEVLDKVKRKLAETGISLVCYGVTGFGKDEASARKVFEFARLMGIETITSEPDAGTMELLDKLAGEYAINVAIHNHPRRADHPDYKYWDPDYVLSVIEGSSPRIGACADVGHWARSNLEPLECLKKLEGRIISLHFKDLDQKGDGHDVIWGTGVCNVKAMLAELKRQNFKGVFSIEYEHNWDNSLPDVDKCVKYFRKAAAELGY